MIMNIADSLHNKYPCISEINMPILEAALDGIAKELPSGTPLEHPAFLFPKGRS